MAATTPASSRWLFGPVPDLMLGCGGLYFCVLAAFSIGGAEVRGAEASWLAPLFVLLLGAPHYGATLLRVYEHRSQRRAYVIFSLYATLAVALVFGVSLFNYVVASWFVTVYLTWSPWHYTGQNFGLAMMFLRRRGGSVSPAARRLVYASFVLSYVLTFLVMHSALGVAPTPEFAGGREKIFVSLGIPDTISTLAFPVLLTAYGATIIGAAALLLRTSSARDLFPSAVMIVTQALWFTVPVAFQFWRVPTEVETFRWDMRSYYFFWIALGHSTQYLWITTYYARRSDDWRSYGRYLGKVLLAGTAIWTLPSLLLDPQRVGILPNTFVLAVLVAAAVNIHHFILDGAIWKLRDNWIANILIRDAPSGDDAGSEGDSGRPWSRHLVWAVATAGCILTFFVYAHAEVLFPRAMAKNDFAAARSTLKRLGWVRAIKQDVESMVDTTEFRYDAAIAGYNRRLEKNLGYKSGAATPYRQAHRHEQAGEWAQAAVAYQKALTLDPTNPVLLRKSANAWLELRRPRKAIPSIKRLIVLMPGDEEARLMLRRAEEMAAPGS